MDVEELFPTTRARLRAALYGEPVPYYAMETDLPMYDEFRGDQALARELARLDPVGRALLLELRRFGYKPGWTFELVQHGHGIREISYPFSAPYQIRIAARVPDSRWRPDAWKGQSEKDRPTTSVTGSQPVWESLWLCANGDRERNTATFEAMLRAMIREVEEHELDEWLAADGKLVHDPHAQKEPSKVGPIHG